MEATSPKWHVRWGIRRDLAGILAIEKECFEFPWREEDFTRCLRQRNCINMVCEAPDRRTDHWCLAGFMIYELHKTRLHLLNFAVARECRRQGAGRAMIDKLKCGLSRTRRARIVLEVRETNLAAQLFFRALGFRAVSVLRDFYEDTTEDAFAMQYRVMDSIERETLCSGK